MLTFLYVTTNQNSQFLLFLREIEQSDACCLCSCFRYNCNRYNEDDAKAARDAQEVRNNSVDSFVLIFIATAYATAAVISSSCLSLF